MAKFYDISLGEYVKNPGEKNLSLERFAVKYLDYQKTNYDELIISNKVKIGDIPAKFYSENSYIIHSIYQNHKKDNTVNNQILNEIEIPLIKALINTELAGVKIDDNKLYELKTKLEIEIKEMEEKIWELSEEKFNINSPKQVGEILFEKMGLPTAKKTKTGYSVDNEVLEELAKKHKIAKYILKYRQDSKLLSTYVIGLTQLINKNTGKLHTTYNQAITSTGRLSSTNPNLQNIPVGTKYANEIRHAFIPFEKDDVIMAFDYSQVELRLLAILSGDTDLVWAFSNNIDIHTTTANFIFAKDDISSEERKIAKSVNFGVIYGISAFGLSKMIDKSLAECREYIAKFYEKYPKVLEYLNSTIAFCEANGYVETMFGRKRYIAGINDRNAMIKKASEREAINMPIQGTSADIIKIAMIKIDDFITENNLKSKMIMQVHDELVFNVVFDEIDLIQNAVTDIMENIIEGNITLKVDVGIGKSRGEAK